MDLEQRTVYTCNKIKLADGGEKRVLKVREGVVVGAQCMWSGKMCRVYEGESVIRPGRGARTEGHGGSRGARKRASVV